MIRRTELAHAATVPALAEHVVGRWGGHDLVVTDVDRLSYAQVVAASRALARRLLAEGVGKGTRVGTQFPYGVEWIVAWIAVNRIGAVLMPFSTAAKPAELATMLALGDVEVLLAPSVLFGADHVDHVARALPALDQAAGPALRVADAPFLRRIWFDGPVDRPWATALGVRDPGPGVDDAHLRAVEEQVTPADASIVVFTSGTTAGPKAVVHSHGALVRKGAHLAALAGWGEDDRVFCGMPFFWIGGIGMTVVPAMSVGATMLCLDRPLALPALELMERERATRLMAWPGVRDPIMDHPTRPGRDIPALDHLEIGLGSLGMTETLASYTYPEADVPVPEGHTGSMGCVADGYEVRVVDPDTGAVLGDGEEGVFAVRGADMMQGMWKREREDVFTADGFYVTGDKGYLLDRMLFFKGRITEMIKTSGNNVSPAEVEGVLRALPGVQQVHVRGVPDRRRGEVVAALVVPEPGPPLDVDGLLERARELLSNYKVPRYVVVVDQADVPLLASGKPDRIRIQQVLAERRPVEAPR